MAAAATFYFNFLNTDSKIIAKVLSNRLKPVLSEIISPDQVSYMKDRLCGENTRHNPGLRLITVRDIWDSQSKTIKSKNYLEGVFNTTIPCMLYNQIVCTVSSVLKSVHKYAGNIVLQKSLTFLISASLT